jgi:hypothetical protein
MLAPPSLLHAPPSQPLLPISFTSFSSLTSSASLGRFPTRQPCALQISKRPVKAKSCVCHSYAPPAKSFKTHHFKSIPCHSYEMCTCKSFVCHSYKGTNLLASSTRKEQDVLALHASVACGAQGKTCSRSAKVGVRSRRDWTGVSSWSNWRAVWNHAWEIFWGAGVIGVAFTIYTLYFSPPWTLLGWGGCTRVPDSWLRCMAL